VLCLRKILLFLIYLKGKREAVTDMEVPILLGSYKGSATPLGSRPPEGPPQGLPRNQGYWASSLSPKLLMKSKVRMKTVHRKIGKKNTVCPTNLGPHMKFTPALHLGFEICNQILIFNYFC
jgi:hypothetical protein